MRRCTSTTDFIPGMVRSALFQVLILLCLVPGCRLPSDRTSRYAEYYPDVPAYRSHRTISTTPGSPRYPGGRDGSLRDLGTEKTDRTATGKPRPISIAEALNSAINQNVESALARAEAEIARQDVRITLGKLVPTLEVGGRISHTDGTVQGSFGELRDVEFGTYEHGAALTYRLNPGALLHENKAADFALEEATLRALDVEQRLILRVAELYLDLLLARENLEIAEALMEDRKKFVDVLRKRASAGVGLGSEVARAEANLASDHRHVVESRNLWESTSVRLAVVLRSDPETLLVPMENEISPWPILPDSQMPGLQARVGNRPDVQAARMAEEGASHRASATWWDVLGPDLTAMAGIDFIGDRFRDQDRRLETGVLLTWSLSFDSFARIGRSQAEEDAAHLRSQALVDRARGEIERAQHDLRAARERSLYAADGLKAAEENHRLSLSRFEAGTAIVLEVLDAENALALARLDVARSSVDYNQAQLRLLASIGSIHEGVFPDMR